MILPLLSALATAAPCDPTPVAVRLEALSGAPEAAPFAVRALESGASCPDRPATSDELSRLFALGARALRLHRDAAAPSEDERRWWRAAATLVPGGCAAPELRDVADVCAQFGDPDPGAAAIRLGQPGWINGAARPAGRWRVPPGVAVVQLGAPGAMTTIVASLEDGQTRRFGRSDEAKPLAASLATAGAGLALGGAAGALGLSLQPDETARSWPAGAPYHHADAALVGWGVAGEALVDAATR
jgi:hypothetical protein